MAAYKAAALAVDLMAAALAPQVLVLLVVLVLPEALHSARLVLALLVSVPLALVQRAQALLAVLHLAVPLVLAALVFH
jgi:uncharacterized membrane protein